MHPEYISKMLSYPRYLLSTRKLAHLPATDTDSQIYRQIHAHSTPDFQETGNMARPSSNKSTSSTTATEPEMDMNKVIPKQSRLRKIKDFLRSSVSASKKQSLTSNGPQNRPGAQRSSTGYAPSRPPIQRDYNQDVDQWTTTQRSSWRGSMDTHTISPRSQNSDRYTWGYRTPMPRSPGEYASSFRSQYSGRYASSIRTYQTHSPNRYANSLRSRYSSDSLITVSRLVKLRAHLPKSCSLSSDQQPSMAMIQYTGSGDEPRRVSSAAHSAHSYALRTSRTYGRPITRARTYGYGGASRVRPYQSSDRSVARRSGYEFSMKFSFGRRD
jgi:hypothetical protein